MEEGSGLTALVAGQREDSFSIDDLQRQLDALDAALRGTQRTGAAFQSTKITSTDDEGIDDDPLPELSPAARFEPAQRSGGADLQWLQQSFLDRAVVEVAQSLLASGAADDAISERLLELFGFDRIELVGEALRRRAGIRKALEAHDRTVIASTAVHAPRLPSAPSAPPIHHQHQPYVPGASITVETTASKQAQKQAAKESRKLARKHRHAAAGDDAGDEMDLDEWQKVREQALRSAADAPLFTGEGRADEVEDNPHIFAQAKGGNTLSWFGQRYTLPEGTMRREHTTYDEITIPAAKKLAMRQGERLIRIDELDDIARGSFPGYQTLNRLQSVVYPIAYHTNENMLVCAPTGAGKTDVAMLTILRAISQYGSVESVGPTNGKKSVMQMTERDFKVVYVAPMKALAAEVVRKMGKRLGWLGFVVKELTGDMQLTKAEIAETHLIVTTPEKWDVVTRKTSGDDDLVSKVRLLIIDEVHLLHEDRGAVIESIVARTLRHVESSQSLIRIVGLSATLPNYIDVSDFLRVNRMQGLFFFDSSFRPVPLEQHFIGVKGKPGSQQSRSNLDDAAFEKVAELVREGHQVMVFVHARKETVKTAETLREKAQAEGILDLFDPSEHPRVDLFKREVASSRNRELKELFGHGFGIHHAGMLRADRTLSERMFEAGLTKVLCCTATLAWGVNLPAYAVVIKGTQIYDASKGSFVDLGILDVLQIFGRAGRPQYEDHGVGYICTTHDKLDHYVSSITQQHPIESKFVDGLVDSLNAEISLGTVTTVDEGVQWIGWTYLQVRMRKNPMVYGMTVEDVQLDPHLGSKRLSLVQIAARKLVSVGMITYDEDTGALAPTELGRIASRYYIRHASIEIFNETFRPKMTEADVLAMLSSSVEFDQIRVRDTETQELVRLMEQAPCQVKGGTVTTPGKVNILLQGYISRAYVEDFALVSDTAYVAQNAGRIARALVEIGTSRKWAQTATVLIEISKSIEKRLWPFAHPLQQLGLPADVVYNLDRWADEVSIEDLAAMSAAEAGKLVHLNERLGAAIVKAAKQFPKVSITYVLQPLTPDLLRVRIRLTRDFEWSQQLHGRGEPIWLWVEDDQGQDIYRLTHLYLRPELRSVQHDLVISLRTVPPAISIRAISDRWVGSEETLEVPLDGLTLPSLIATPTQLLNVPLLDLNDLPDSRLVAALRPPRSHFTPLETQCLHNVLHTPHNVLLATTEDSLLTTMAIVALHRSLSLAPEQTSVFICSNRSQASVLASHLQRIATHYRTSAALISHHTGLPSILPTGCPIVLTSAVVPECISKIANPALLVLCDLQTLDEATEMAISSARRSWSSARVVGLSTSLLESASLACWLGVATEHSYNFASPARSNAVSHSVRSFDIPYSHALTAAMIKPAWTIIRSAPAPVIVFVSSAGQSRAVARDFLKQSASTMDPQALARSEELLAPYAARLKDQELADALLHGIMVIHGSMTHKEQRLMVGLFTSGSGRVLITPRHASWSADLQASTVIVLGTQFLAIDAAGHRTVHSYDPTEVLQMQTRAKSLTGAADFVVMCHEEYSTLYSKCLLSGVPLESALTPHSPPLLAAVLMCVCEGTLGHRQGIVDLLSWTFLSHRLLANPFYYDLTTDTDDTTDDLISRFADAIASTLFACGTVKTTAETISATALGRLAARRKQSLRDLERLRSLKLGDISFAPKATAPAATNGAASQTEQSIEAYHGRLPRHVRDAIGPVDFTDPAARSRILLAGWLQRRVPAEDQLEAEQAAVVMAVVAGQFAPR